LGSKTNQDRGVAAPPAALPFDRPKGRAKRAPQLPPPGCVGSPTLRRGFGDRQKLALRAQTVCRSDPETSASLRRWQKGEEGQGRGPKHQKTSNKIRIVQPVGEVPRSWVILTTAKVFPATPTRDRNSPRRGSAFLGTLWALAKRTSPSGGETPAADGRKTSNRSAGAIRLKPRSLSDFPVFKKIDVHKSSVTGFLFWRRVHRARF